MIFGQKVLNISIVNLLHNSLQCIQAGHKKPLPLDYQKAAALIFLETCCIFDPALLCCSHQYPSCLLQHSGRVSEYPESCGAPALFCLKVSTWPQNIDSYIDRHKILWYKDRVIDYCAHSAEMRGAGRFRSVRGYALHTLLGLYARREERCDGVGDNYAPGRSNLTPASDKCYNKGKIKGVLIKL